MNPVCLSCLCLYLYLDEILLVRMCSLGRCRGRLTTLPLLLLLLPLLQEELALQPCALTPLHNHRRVLGVIGVMHCPHVGDIAKAYQQFEQRCK